MTEVKQLSAKAKGRWLITTQGSQHIWDMDEMTWIRVQRDGLNPMEHDFTEVHIVHVIRMPAVGGTFEMHWSERKDGPWTWHRSSTIRKIEELKEE